MDFRHTNFLGNEMAQNRDEFMSWKGFLEEYNFKRFIELGTWKGGFALYMINFCEGKGVDFNTFDIEDYEDTPEKQEVNFSKYFYKLDIWKHIKYLKELIEQEGRTILFCDGGNKIKEFITFSPFLKKDDIIVIHDWGVEIRDGDVDAKDFEEIFNCGRLMYFKKL